MSGKTVYFLAGGVGGVLPTTVTLATMLTKSPTATLSEPIAMSFYAGLCLFFLIGGAVSICTVEDSNKLRDFIVAGIAAPALITSIVAGVDKSQSATASIHEFFVSGAYAAEYEAEKEQIQGYNYEVKSLPYGSNDWRQSSLGYDVILEDSLGDVKKLSIKDGSIAPITVTTDAPLKKVLLKDNSGNAISEFKINADSSGELLVQPFVESEKDFFWALGAKGKAKVIDAEAQFIPETIKKNEPSNNLKE